MARVEIDPSWHGAVMANWQAFADSQLGEEISDDARRYCPVRSGALKASIAHYMEGDDLIVSATGGGEDDQGRLFVFDRPGRLTRRTAGIVHPNPGRNPGSLVTRHVHHVETGGHPYATFVELGHRVYHESTGITGPGAASPRPFLRPALYQRRGGK